MSKIIIISALFFIFIPIFTLFSCSKSPPKPNIASESPPEFQKELEILQNQLKTAEQQTEAAFKTNEKTLEDLHDAKVWSAWITGICVSVAVVCLFMGVGIGLKTKQDALNADIKMKGDKTSGKRSAKQSTGETKSET